MLSGDDLAELIAVTSVFGIWAYRVHLGHIRKVMEMRAMRGEPLDDPKIELERLRREVRALRPGISGGGSGEIAALRQEITRLRDTSTQYDVSIDQALQELQQRVATLENRLRQAGQATAPDEIHINRSR